MLTLPEKFSLHQGEPACDSCPRRPRARKRGFLEALHAENRLHCFRTRMPCPPTRDPGCPQRHGHFKAITCPKSESTAMVRNGPFCLGQDVCAVIYPSHFLRPPRKQKASFAEVYVPYRGISFQSTTAVTEKGVGGVELLPAHTRI